MKYMGSKLNIAKHILPIILKDRVDNQWYVEPFVGGCNSIDKVDGKRIGNDSNYYLVSMWNALKAGWEPDINIDKNKYTEIKNNKNKYSPELVGWVGFGCSYSGKWFGGYAGKTKTKIGTVRDYIFESYNSVLKQAKLISDVVFYNLDYLSLKIPDNSIIYCDPPYQGTTKYKDEFDHDNFWNWVREKTYEGHSIFISEYSAPKDFNCIWEKPIKSSLSANGKYGGSKMSIEKLFVHKSKY